MKIGIALLIAAGAGFFLLKGDDPSCESACKHAVSAVAQDKDWSQKKMAKEVRECSEMCTEQKWSSSTRNCVAGIKDQTDVKRCFEK
jgi:hypothetical protein